MLAGGVQGPLSGGPPGSSGLGAPKDWESACRRLGSWVAEMLGARSPHRSLLRSTWVYASLHGATDQALPAAYKALEAHLGLSPTALGSASSLARLAHAFACPVWGVVVDSWGGVLVLSVTACIWGVCTALMGALSAAWQLPPLMFLSGLSMAAMGPVTQKLLADAAERGRIGSAFGMLSFSQSLGRMLSLLSITGFAATSILGLMGWRLSFFLMGFLSIFLAMYSAKTFLPRVSPQHPIRQPTLSSSPWDSLSQLNYVLKNKSFWIMLIMGVCNGVPRSAVGFMPMWLEYCGLGEWGASSVVSVSLVTAMAVSPFVGIAADNVHQRYPVRGRAVVAQAAIVCRALLMFFMLRCIDRSRDSLVSFLAVSAAMGLCAGWPGVGVNRPILTEIVMASHRATVFSLVSTTEAVGAALLGAPAVGFLAEHAFGYVRPLKRQEGAAKEDQSVSPSNVDSLANAEALSKALLLTTVVPWALSVCLYWLLMLTYNTDRHIAIQLHRSRSSSSSSSTAAAGTHDLELGRIEADAEDTDIQFLDPRGPGSKAAGYYIQVASSVHTPKGEEPECPSLDLAPDTLDEHAAAAEPSPTAAAPAATSYSSSSFQTPKQTTRAAAQAAP